MDRIVVGVDGSSGSVAALRWAIEEADIWSVPVEVVHVYSFRPQLGEAWTYGLTPQLPESLFEEAHARAEEELDAMLKEVVPDGIGVEVIARVVEGRPAERLIEISKDARMLVVGTRGLGGFRSLLLGSVSSQCVQHAECPVVVVPEGAEHVRTEDDALT
jgi:nucleotide-binding universal stress UspA family protein